MPRGIGQRSGPPKIFSWATNSCRVSVYEFLCLSIWLDMCLFTCHSTALSTTSNKQQTRDQRIVCLNLFLFVLHPYSVLPLASHVLCLIVFSFHKQHLAFIFAHCSRAGQSVVGRRSSAVWSGLGTRLSLFVGCHLPLPCSVASCVLPLASCHLPLSSVSVNDWSSRGYVCTYAATTTTIISSSYGMAICNGPKLRNYSTLVELLAS